MKTIEIRSVICIECNLPNSLDENNRCAFCRRYAESPSEQVVNRRIGMGFDIILLIVAAIVGNIVVFGIAMIWTGN